MRSPLLLGGDMEELLHGDIDPRGGDDQVKLVGDPQNKFCRLLVLFGGDDGHVNLRRRWILLHSS